MISVVGMGLTVHVSVGASLYEVEQRWGGEAWWKPVASSSERVPVVMDVVAVEQRKDLGPCSSDPTVYHMLSPTYQLLSTRDLEVVSPEVDPRLPKYVVHQMGISSRVNFVDYGVINTQQFALLENSVFDQLPDDRKDSDFLSNMVLDGTLFEVRRR